MYEKMHFFSRKIHFLGKRYRWKIKKALTRICEGWYFYIGSELVHKLHFVDVAWFGCWYLVGITKTYTEAKFVILAEA